MCSFWGDFVKYVTHITSIVQIIFSFWSFGIKEGIWGNQKLLIGLDSFSKQLKNVGLNLVYIGLCVDCLVKMIKITVFFSGSFRQVMRVTEEDSISETVVWTIFILINIVTALKGTHF